MNPKVLVRCEKSEHGIGMLVNFDEMKEEDVAAILSMLICKVSTKKRFNFKNIFRKTFNAISHMEEAKHVFETLCSTMDDIIRDDIDPEMQDPELLN